ncbi:Acetyltransferase (GNAT) family protein [Arboricoccus pini]|uniref:Acetyltransferase (GNAT) family protein n=1 Tax=Arboricoccus pini TaxID=1963835 RepID=A0A212RLY2_9PROT|nr:GNAT family N-acetyltransferase [Arboricoccus pini]SNB73357.1 Acetyltransferase (GNAT) family protein [Arboricoccus pini]
MLRDTPADQRMAAWIDIHVRLQSGCYVSGVDPGPDGSRLVWSETIADFGLNYVLGASDAAWVREAAARRNRAPVLLAADMAEARDLCLRFDGAPTAAVAWMVRSVEQVDADLGSASVETSREPAPGADFLAVMRQLSDNEALNRATADAYGPTLAAATSGPGVAVRHLLLRADGRPAACASVHAADGVAGLYNVGVAADLQRRGLGQAVTRAAIATAVSLGCATLFLQCLPGGHVERLYARLGFRRIARPLLIALRS